MKKKILAALTAAVMAVTATASLPVISAAADDDMLIPVDFSEYGTGCLDDEDIMMENAEDNKESFLSEFFELPLNEIEEHHVQSPGMTGDHSAINIGITYAQLKKLMDELEPKREWIGKDIGRFREAFFGLLLEKLHLTGIYEVFDPDYFEADLPNAWLEHRYPFTLEDADEADEDALCTVTLRYHGPYGADGSADALSLDYNGQNITVSWAEEEKMPDAIYELTLRSLYVINEYGDKSYFSEVFSDEICWITEGDADPEQANTQLSEFLELPIEEIKAELGNRFAPTASGSSAKNAIVILLEGRHLTAIEAETVSKMKDAGKRSLRSAFISMFLEKMHLKEVYDLLDPRYEYIGLLKSCVNDQQALSELSELSKHDVVEIGLSFYNWRGREDYHTTDDQRKVLKMSDQERAMRALYTVLKYGDKQYYCDAAQLLLDRSTAPTEPTKGDADCNGAVQIADAILLSRYLAEDPVVITAQGLQNAELDGNPESLDAGDFAALLQLLAGTA